MAEDLLISGTTKATNSPSMIPQIHELLGGENDLTATIANVCAALKFGMDFFWVGFYLIKENQLVLGPFQGPVACTRINKGKGVCGVSWEKSEVIIVDDVDQFPGHIACSALSKSEIVLPVYNSKKEIVGVMDVDSESYSTFDKTDEKYLMEILNMLRF